MSAASMVPVASLPAGVVKADVTRTGATTTRVAIRLDGSVRPSERTDFVFVVDVSATMQAVIEDGSLASTMWSLLQYVSQFDDDGIDFFLASTLSADSAGAAVVLAALAAGRSPTDSELANAHGVVSVGQCATLTDIQGILASEAANGGLAGVLTPALRAARGKRKPDGRLFVQLITDARLVDDDAFVREIAAMSTDCRVSRDEARYRIHVLGLGDVDRDRVARWDDGIGDVAPVDIVASSIAADVTDIAAEIFKEMQAYMTGGEVGLLDVRGDRIKSVAVLGQQMEDDGSGAFASAFEQLPLDFFLDFEFEGEPGAVEIDISVGGLDPLQLAIPKV